MESKVSERVTPSIRSVGSASVPCAAPAPDLRPRARRASPLADAAALVLAPAALGCVVLLGTSSFGFDLREAVLVPAGERARDWRAFGALALAASGAGVAACVWRAAGSRLAAALAGAVATTHALAIVVSADVRGTWMLLAFAAFTCAAAAAGRSLRRLVATGTLLAAGALLMPAGLAAADASRLLPLALNRAPDAHGAAFLAPLAALALLAASLRRVATAPHARVVAFCAAGALALMGISAARAAIKAQQPARALTQRFLDRLDSHPPVTGNAVEVVLDAPVSDRALLAAARPHRAVVHDLGMASGAAHVRLLRWGTLHEEGLMAMAPPDLHSVFDAALDPAIVLDAPSDGARIAAARPEDEPDFRFTIPGPEIQARDLRVIIVAATPGRHRTLVRELEEGTVRRTRGAGDTSYTWRPGWRPMECGERELIWEQGDVCPPGSSFWWSIGVADDAGPCGDVTRIAPLRRVFVTSP